MSMRLFQVFQTLALVAALAVALATMTGCMGGGSEGTGEGRPAVRSVTGTLADADSQPVSGAKVEILETASIAYTNAEGSFTIQDTLPSGPLTLQVRSGDQEDVVSIADIDENTNVVGLEIQFDRQNKLLVISNLHFWSRMGKECERFFDNQKVIVQKRPTAANLRCTIRFFINSGVTQLENVPGALEVRACNSSLWRTISTGMTGANENAGVGDLVFNFRDDFQFCEYRVIAPYQIATPPLSQYLATLTLQNYGAEP